MKQCLLFLFLAALTITKPAYSQYLFLDVNGDGHNSLNLSEPGNGSDCLNPAITQIDIYFDTNHNPDGSPTTCDQTAANPLSMNSYEILLRGSGTGSVSFNGWTDNVGFTTGVISLGDSKFYASGKDAWIGLAGSTLPPGRYKVGTLGVTVTDFATISFVPLGGSAINPNAETAFGTQCEGNDFDGTYKLGSDFASNHASGTCYGDAVEALTWGKIKQRYR